MIKEKINILPENPGCYLFKNSEGKIIYIGKAKNLKKRVSSYFQKKDHDEKTKVLVSNIDSFDYIVTNSEVESLILENNLIKKHSPKYNIDLKDSKRYAYILATYEDYPRLLIERNKRNEDGKLFGPFTSSQQRDYILDFVIKTFKIRTCRKFPKKECLRYHIGICSAPCTGRISKEEYLKTVEDSKKVLGGEIKFVSAGLKEKMDKFSKEKDFENALLMRDRINSLNYLLERQSIERQKKYDEDILNYMIIDGKVVLMLFNIYKGTLENKQVFEFDYHEGFLEEFITRFYSENDIPKEIVVPEEIEDSISEFLSGKKGSKVLISLPKSGERKTLLLLVKKNIELQYLSSVNTLNDLKEKLRLPVIPRIIECFDISHLSGTMTVASMVQFRDSIPSKENYRKFKIRTVEGIDDFSSIAEVVRRRYQRLIYEKGEMPNLIMIDGGRGQLNSALSVLKELNVKVPTISLAKREEEIYVPGLLRPLKLDKRSDALKLLQRVRDESHRFAINYNRNLRSKNILKEK